MIHLPLPISILPSDINPQHESGTGIWPFIESYKAVAFIQFRTMMWTSTLSKGEISSESSTKFWSYLIAFAHSNFSADRQFLSRFSKKIIVPMANLWKAEVSDATQ